MLTSDNRNLIFTYLITLGIAAFLTVIIVNFNNWFFPDEELNLSGYVPTAGRMISERNLNFGLLTDKKFTSLEPILDQAELAEITTEEGTTTTAKPSVRQPIELRYDNPFIPF